MISLALHGKIPIVEDVLTAALFDCFRLHPERRELRALLLASRAPYGCVLPAFERVEVELWPQHRAGEPDVRLLLLADKRIVGWVVVESKLGAAKSGTGEVSDDRRMGDQLAKYLLAEHEDHPSVPTYLLYLTHHGSLPREEIADSAKLVRAVDEALANAFLWLSWRDVESALRGMAERGDLADVRNLLERAGMARFSRFAAGRLDPLAASSFYRRSVQPRGNATRAAVYPGTSLPPALPDKCSWKYIVRSERGWAPAPELLGSSRFYEVEAR